MDASPEEKCQGSEGEQGKVCDQKSRNVVSSELSADDKEKDSMSQEESGATRMVQDEQADSPVADGAAGVADGSQSPECDGSLVGTENSTAGSSEESSDHDYAQISDSETDASILERLFPEFPSCDDGDEDDDDDDENTSDEDIGGGAAEPDIPGCTEDTRCPAMTRWSTAYDLRRRHLGLCSASSLRRRAMSSYALVRRLDKEREIAGHEGCVNTLHYSEDGEVLASSGDDLNVMLWDWRRGKRTLAFASGHSSNVFQAKFMPSCLNSMMVSTARDGLVRRHLLTPSGDVTSKTVAEHDDAAHKLALEPGNPHTVRSCGEDGKVFSIDLRTDECELLVQSMELRSPRHARLYSIFTNPVQPWYFAVSGSSRTLSVYDQRYITDDRPVQLYTVKSMKEHATVTCVVYSNDGKELLATYNDESIYIFNTELSRTVPVHRYTGHRNNDTIKGVNFFGPNSEYVVSGSDCGHVFIWEKSTEKVVQLLKADEVGAVNCLEPNPQCMALATSGLEHTVKVWTPHARRPTDMSGLEAVTSRNATTLQHSSAWLVNVLMEHRIRSLMRHRRMYGNRAAAAGGV
eukprot:scpid88606/ scgid12165/ DDB1- and CUL4-associated factor 8; WD repeat-containing protein 42A